MNESARALLPPEILETPWGAELARDEEYIAGLERRRAEHQAFLSTIATKDDIKRLYEAIIEFMKEEVELRRLIDLHDLVLKDHEARLGGHERRLGRLESAEPPTS